ncbi:MAG: DUF2085 domain-containing protein, partial [Caldilineaceae bacterium]|nr:DUF2085 domain-containing protein [Caldilineaceae bacterium]
RHWLALFGAAWGLYVIMPLLAPLFMHWGWVAPARYIYAAYSYACHQLPDHSYFLFGKSLTPSLHDLEGMGLQPGLGLLEQRKFIGSTEAGYKVAICERDVAIYGAIFLAGLVFALFRHRRWQLSWQLFVLLTLPIAIDGGTQLLGLHQSNWWLRTITGALFGIASVLFAYPIVDGAMQEIAGTSTRIKPISHN